MIQRYRHEDGHGAYLPDPEGDVVDYGDHEAEASRLRADLETSKARVAALEAALIKAQSLALELLRVTERGA